MTSRLLALPLAATIAAGCGDGAPSGTATVAFVYAAPTTTDPAVAAQFPACVQGVGQTHIHPSWRGFVRVELTAEGSDRWTVTFDDVPVAIENRIRVSDPNTCAQNATGASTTGVSANGVTLTRVVDTPGSGTEPGLAFTVDGDGIVVP